MIELDFTKIATAVILALLVWNFTTVKDLSEKTAIMVVKLESMERAFDQRVTSNFNVLLEKINALDKRIKTLEANKR